MKMLRTYLAAVVLWMVAPPAQAGQSVTLAWNANSETNLAGYRLYWGQASRAYVSSNVVAVSATTSTVTNLVTGERYHFAVTAFTVDGLESDYSDEVVFGFKPAKPFGLFIQSSLQTSLSPTGPWETLWTINQNLRPTNGAGFYRNLLALTPTQIE